MVTWVLESDVFSESCFDAMVAHLTATDTPFHVVKVIPFVHEIAGKKPTPTGPVVVYGSIGTQKLARAEGWTPGVWTNDNFNYETYRDALGHLILNPDCSRMKLSEVSDYLKTAFPNPEDQFFIKPNGDTKEFAGTVMERAEFDTWLHHMQSIGYLEESDFDVVVSSVKKLGCEWRVVVVDGKISSASIYRQYGVVRPQEHIIHPVEQVVMQAHALFQPAPVYVIDIAQHYVEDEGEDQYKVIEYNTFNSAGLYACNVAKIIDDINAYVEGSLTAG